MRHLILLYFTFFGLNSFSQFDTFPDSNATWVVSWYDFGFVTRYHTVVPSFDSDTLIDGMNYSKVYGADCLLNLEEYYGAYRSLTSGETYFIPKDSTEEHFLRKFNVEVGDSVITWISGFEPPFHLDTLIITAIEYEDGIPTVHTNLGNEWVPGHGSYRDGLWNSDGAILGSAAFTCEGIFDTTGTAYTAADMCLDICSESTSSIREERQVVFTITPNPTNNLCAINWESSTTVLTYKLCNVSGQIISVGTISQGEQLDLRSFDPGIYFLDLSHLKQRFVQKVIRN